MDQQRRFQSIPEDPLLSLGNGQQQKKKTQQRSAWASPTSAHSSTSSRHASSSSLQPPGFSISADNLPYQPNGSADVFAESDKEVEDHNRPFNTMNGGNASANSTGMAHMDVRPETWYDPEGADSYSAAQAFWAVYNGTQPPSTTSQPAQSAQQTFRDPVVIPSPFASPSMSAHHRTSSFGSDLGSPPRFLPPDGSSQQWQQQDQQANGGGWMPNEMGMQNMTLADQTSGNASYTGTFYQQPNFADVSSSTSSLQSQLSQYSGLPATTTVPGFDYSTTSGQASLPDGSLEQLIAQHTGQQQQQQQQPSVPQLAVNDTQMSQATAKPVDKNQATFEEILQSLNAEDLATTASSSGGPAPYTGYPTQEQQQQQQQQFGLTYAGLQHPNRSAPNVASPWGQSNASADSSGKESSVGATEASSVHNSFSSPQSSAPSSGPISARQLPFVQQLRKPTRDDSFDKLKKFLKLDVDMAYSGPEDDSPTMMTMRKRSASDTGPAALAAFGPGSFTEESAASAKANFAEANADIDQAIAAKFGIQPGRSMGPTSRIVMTQQMQPSASYGQTQQQQWVGNTHTNSNSSRPGGGLGPMRASFSGAAREAGAGTPYQTSNRGGMGGGSTASSRRTSVSSADWSQSDMNPVAQQQQQYNQLAGGSDSRRSHSSPRYGSHRRAAQSEDLSSLARDHDPQDFLRYITAPDGSLAPPSRAAPLPGSGPGRASPYHAGGSSRPMYQTSHDRAGSFGSRASGSDGFYDDSAYNPNANSMLAPQLQPGQGLSPSMFQGGAFPNQQQQQQQQQSYASLQGHPQSHPTTTRGNNSGSSNDSSPAAGGLANASIAATAGSPSSASSSSAHSYSQTGLRTYSSLGPMQPSPSGPGTVGRSSGGGASRRRSSHASASSSTSSLAALGLSSSNLVNPPVQNVTTSKTQAASASRRKNDASFVCPVQGCGSQFTRQFNLRSHLRSHADERPFKCPAPGCDKAFARAHDAKRHHETLHLSVKKHVCEWCGKSFARLDALHRHLKPESGTCADKAGLKEEPEAAGGTTFGSRGSSDGSASLSPVAGANLFARESSYGSNNNAAAGASPNGQKFGGHVL